MSMFTCWLDQLERSGQDRPRLEYEANKTQFNSTKSSLYVRSYLEFPYSFQLQARNQWLQGKKLEEQALRQYYLKSKENQYAGFIAVMRHCQQNFQDNNVQTWLVDAVSLQVCTSFRNVNNSKVVIPCTQKYIPVSMGTARKKAQQDMLFLGRQAFRPDGSIAGICLDSPRVSSKHLLLIRSPNHSTATALFLFCLKWVDRKSSLFCLPNPLVRTIVSYLGSLTPCKYSVKDLRSTNGTQYYPREGYPLNKQKRELLMLEPGHLIGIEYRGVVRKSKLSDVKTNVDYLIAQEVRQAKIEVCNRKIGCETDIKEGGEILLLKQVTPFRKRLHVLYSEEAPYRLQIIDQGVRLEPATGDPVTAVSQGYGQITFGELGWKIRPYVENKLHINLKPEVCYTLRQSNYFRLGNSVQISIHLNTAA